MKCIALLSGGIDSPVAAYLMAKKGYAIVLLHMDNGHFSDGSGLKKSIALRDSISKAIHRSIPMRIASHGDAQAAFDKNCRKNLQCVLCKRMMLRVAEIVAKKEGAVALVMGDSLGQVASQTLRNIRVVESAVSIPIIRPLIGLDKTEIIEIARSIGTFELSILPGIGCTAVPKKVVTHAVHEVVVEEEGKIDIAALAEGSAKSVRIS